MSDRVDDGMKEHPLANYPRPPPRGEDLPFSDGEPMESGRHVDQMGVLKDSLRIAWKDRSDFFVGGNMFVYFSETQSRKNDFRGPDVFVVTNTRGHNRKSWVVWEEDGKTPDVVIELLSPKTEHVDRGKKKDIYAKLLKVDRYFVYDPYTYVFEGWALVDGEYVPLEPNENGDLDCTPLGLRIGPREGNLGGDECPVLRWIDVTGQPLATGEELAAEAERLTARLRELEGNG